MTSDPVDFYDTLAEHYHLVYEDWEASMHRQGARISAMLGGVENAKRVLDVSAGIGTQSLPLAGLGHEVVARDASPGAVARLRREAARRELTVDAARADMRGVAASVGGSFDAVISFDNSVPHLLSEADILAAFRGFGAVLRRDGVLLVSVRDYDAIDRSSTSVHPYGERVHGGRRYRARQEWVWHDDRHYRTTMVIEAWASDGWEELVRSTASYQAIPVGRLLALMETAGFESTLEPEDAFFQPVLRGRLRGSEGSGIR